MIYDHIFLFLDILNLSPMMHNTLICTLFILMDSQLN